MNHQKGKNLVEKKNCTQDYLDTPSNNVQNNLWRKNVVGTKLNQIL